MVRVMEVVTVVVVNIHYVHGAMDTWLKMAHLTSCGELRYPWTKEKKNPPPLSWVVKPCGDKKPGESRPPTIPTFLNHPTYPTCILA